MMRGRSLTHRLLVYIIGSAVVTLLAGAAITSWVAWRQTSARLEASAMQAQRSLSAALADSLWMVDRGATEGQIAAGLAFEGVVRVQVQSFTGQNFVKESPSGPGEHAVYRSTIVHEGRRLGTLEIAVGRTALVEGVLAQVALLLGLVTLIAAVFAVTAYFLVQREIAKPLQRFVRRIEGYQPGTPLPPEEAWMARAGTEMSQLSAAFTRMHEAIEQQLRRERELCEQALASDRAKSEFLANMSHELRTPMHAILSFAGLGLEKATQPTAQAPRLHGYFDRINRSADRLMALLNDLLDLSKLEAGRMTYDIRPQSLTVAVEDAVAEFAAMAVQRAQRVRIVGLAGLAPMGFDRERIGQVLRNLLSNALKFNRPGGTVTVRARRVDVGGHAMLEVAVLDEGIGIPEGELEAVFDKFVQSSKTSSGAGGTGLGLAICREIVLAHGGTIVAANGAAGGAVISFTLPLEVAAPAVAPAEEALSA